MLLSPNKLQFTWFYLTTCPSICQGKNSIFLNLDKDTLLWYSNWMDAIRQPLVLNPPPNITRVVDMESLDKLLAFLEKTPEFGFDIETTPTKDYYFRRIRTLQFGNNQEQYVIDLLAWCDYNPDVLYACQGDYGKQTAIEPNIGMLVSKLSPYLSSNKYLKVGVNLSFEYECLYWLLGLRTYGYYDCMLAEKCIYAGLGGHASLKNYKNQTPTALEI